MYAMEGTEEGRDEAQWMALSMYVVRGLLSVT